MSDSAKEMARPALGETHQLTITDLAFGGEGVARIGDFVVFVPFVLVNEVVEAELIEVKKHFARARLKRVLQSSPHRVQPGCPYFGECGGCQYQHLEYPLQLELKGKQIRDILERIGGFSGGLVAPVVPCPSPYAYRNRIMIRSQWNKPKQGLNIGFLMADSGLVVDVEECKIVEPGLNDQLRHVRANPPPKGGIKVVLRVVPAGWQVPRDTFFQNNSILLPGLVAAVKNRLQDSGNPFLVDSYCGVGFFSLELASAVEQFVGIEYDRQAVHAARANAAARQCANGEFLEGKTEDLLEGILARFSPQKTTVILDPPRTGCVAAGLHHLRAAGPSQIIYVSCHPATLARDLKLLCADGAYELAQVIPLDMFPQTQHVECVADLRIKRAFPAGADEPVPVMAVQPGQEGVPGRC